MKKRALSIFLCIALALSFVQVPAFATTGADGSISISVGQTTLKAGETTDVTFQVNATSDAVGAVNFTVNIPSGLEYVSHEVLVSTSDFLMSSYTPEDGKFGCGVTAAGKTGAFNVLKLTVRAKDANLGNNAIGATIGDMYKVDGSTTMDFGSIDSVNIYTYKELTGDQTITMGTKPDSGAATSTVAASGTNFTVGFDNWKEQGVEGAVATFAAGKTYTAECTLTANTGYVFAAEAEAAIAGSGNGSAGTSTVSVDGKTLKFPYTFEIPPLPNQNVTFATPTAMTKTYGDVEFTNTATNTTTDGPAPTYASDNSGVATVNSTSGEVTIVGQGEANITATAAAGTYGGTEYAETKVSYKLTVEPKELTNLGYTGVTVTKVYDGTINAGAVGGTAITFDGIVGTDDVSIKAVAGDYENKKAETGKTVTLTLSLDGAKKENYKLSSYTHSFDSAAITAADYTYTVGATQDFLVGSGLDAITVAPQKGTGVDGEDVNGTFGWYSDSSRSTNAQDSDLNTVSAEGTITLYWKFTATDTNYSATPKEGQTVFTAKNKANVSSNITFANGELTYTGAGQTFENATISGVSGGTWTYSYTAGTGTLDSSLKPLTVGTYTVKAVYEDAEYYGEKTATLTIKPKEITVPAADTTVYTYNGSPQTYQIVAGEYSVTGNTQTAANETGYTVTVALNDTTNTVWADGTTADKTFTFIIEKATPTGTPAYTPITADGKTLAEAALATGTLNPSAGELKWVDDSDVELPTTTTVEKNKAYKWKFIPTDTNYKDVSGTITPYYVAPAGGGGYIPPVQKPTIEAGEGVKVTLSADGTVATITVDPAYELADVVLNGTSKGKVTEVKGLKTGDKLVVTATKKATEPTEPTKEEILAALADQQLVARSKVTTTKSGKKAILITWYNADGEAMDFDGVEIFRSTKRYTGFGKKPIFTSVTGKYYNTAITEGTRYYYRVRGFVIIDGQKYYTDYSMKAIRTVK